MTNREYEIVKLIKENPMISPHEIADKLGITRSSASVHIMNLIKKGYIKGRGYIISEQDYVAIIGAANMDIHGFTFEKLITKQSNEGKIKLSTGGSPRNVAENLSRLNYKCKLVAAIGDDIFGQRILEDCRNVEIDVEDCLLLQNSMSSIYMAFVDNDGDIAMGLSDMTIEDRITADFIQEKSIMLKKAKGIVMGSGLPLETIEFILSNFGGHEIFVDVTSIGKAKRIIDFLGRIKNVMLNKFEAEFVSGISINNIEDLKKAGQIIHDKGVSRVFITCGKEGAYYKTMESEGYFPATPIIPVNSSGAGDAFMAGIVYTIVNGLSLDYGMRFAMACSTMALMSETTVNRNINIEGIEKMLKESKSV